jgi:murein DD-endopeptidase MepM/ murein hydrolase activator NlpD
MAAHIEIPDHVAARVVHPPFPDTYPSYQEGLADKGKNPFGTFYPKAKELGKVGDTEGARQLCYESTTEIAIETINHFEETTTIEEGLQFYSYAIKLANKGITMQWMKGIVDGGQEGIDYDQTVPGAPNRGEEVLWRTSEYILLRLHERYGYALSFGLELPEESIGGKRVMPLENPVPVNYQLLGKAFPSESSDTPSVERFANGLLIDRSGEYHYRIETVSPSHKDELGANRYCIDIVVPEGTEVVSPFEGRLVKRITSSDEYGIGPEFGDKDNRVLVEVADVQDIKIIASLRHLAPQGVPGRMRDRLHTLGLTRHINQAAHVGTVGMTGWTTTPHLHLEIGAYKEVKKGQFYLLRTYPIVMIAP